MKKIKYNSLLKINGYPYHITGKTNDSYLITNAVQLNLKKDDYLYLRKLCIYNESGRFEEDINKEKNIKLYEIFIEKFSETIYSKKMASINHKKKTKHLKDLLIEELENFKEFNLENQVELISQIIMLLKCKEKKANQSIQEQ